MIHLRQLGPAFIRHVEAYGLLAAAAARDLRVLAMRRLMLVAVAAVLAIATVVLLGATVIAAGWGTPYRGWIAAAVLVVLAAAAFGCLAAAGSDLPASNHLRALKDEWQKDRAWLAARGDRGPRDRGGSAVTPAAHAEPLAQVRPSPQLRRGTDAGRSAASPMQGG